MKQPFFTGVCTALVTPFLNGNVNYPMLERLLSRQMDAGIHTIVLCGTTGESATLTDSEKLEMIHRAKLFVGANCKIIAGTGSNNTEHTVALSMSAENAGADGLLVVSPYYNKATSDGLMIHYSAVAASVRIPLIVYNVPSRTGVDIPPAVYGQLSGIKNIAGVKEASSDISKITRIRSICSNDFSVWTGNDDQIVPAMALGCWGVISVISNIFPEKTKSMAHAALAGDFDTAADLQVQLLPFIECLFREINPIPVKEALRQMGFDCGDCRLPLTPAVTETRKILKKLLSEV